MEASLKKQLQEYTQKIEAAVEASDGGAPPPLSEGGAPFSFGLTTNPSNVPPAFPAFNTAAATTSIFTCADIPLPNEFTFGAAVKTENAPHYLVSSGPSFVNPNTANGSMDES